MKRSCDTCDFFHHQTINQISGQAPYNGGTCRLRPPVVIMDRAEMKSEWPTVRGYHWCGEYQINDETHEVLQFGKGLYP